MFEMTIKGAIFDIDDTLYSHKTNEVPFLALKALRKLKDKGIKIGVCTSREVKEMNSVPKELLDLVDCQIIDTGAVTYVKDEYYKSYTLDKEIVKKYIKYFEDNNISYHFSDINGDCCFAGDKSLVEDGFMLKLCNGHVFYQKYDDEDITNLGFYHVTEKQLEDIKSINPNAYLSLWGNSGHIAPNFVDKSFGVLKFCQIFSFTPDELIAVGDGSNDDIMLEMVQIGIATIDAKDKTKQAADYVCKKPIEEGGIYDALVDLKIIEDDFKDYDAFFFDNDSTLFDHTPGNKYIHDSVYEALTKLKKRGKKLCMITSRGYDEMFNVPKDFLELFDDVNMLSGGYNLSKGEISIEYVDQEVVEKAIELFDKYELTYRYCTDDGGGYLNRHDKDKEDLFYNLYEMTPPVKKYEGEKVLHLLFYADKDLRMRIKNELGDISYSDLSIAGEISPSGISKGTSMEKTCKKYGVPLEKACAFGDSGNDIDMLKKAGLGICLENGSKDAKEAADYITDSVDQDGVYKALVKFGLI